MKNIRKLIFVFTGMTIGLFPAFSQTEEEIEKELLTRMVEVEDPVYMPVLGIGTGYFNYYGNVNDAFRSYTIGKPGFRVNVATFLGKKHYVRANLVFMMGELSGTQRSVPEKIETTMVNNRNFKSNIYSFGVNAHYSFEPWLQGKIFKPFISVGVETLQFDTKADYLNVYGLPYYFWTDGTIRISPETSPFNPNIEIISRDYNYETNLRKENQTGLGRYSQFSLAIPVDVGFDFNVSSRVTLRAATSLHYAFTDLIDDLSPRANKNPEYKGKIGHNMYTFTYLSLHLDLFSSAKWKKVEDLIANIDDFDTSMWDDQDDDGVPDYLDLCPDTPSGIPVDSVGCPFDSDGDGVPDYLDREPNSRPGAIVDEYGVEINANMVVEILHTPAIRRSDVEMYLMMYQAQNKARRSEALPIPNKFKKVDTNGDGYISYDELLKAINDYFDGTSGFSPKDIKELKDFFFEQ